MFTSVGPVLCRHRWRWRWAAQSAAASGIASGGDNPAELPNTPQNFPHLEAMRGATQPGRVRVDTYCLPIWIYMAGSQHANLILNIAAIRDKALGC